MTDIPFSYEDYEIIRQKLFEKVNNLFTKQEEDFLLSFEQGSPKWDKCSIGNLSEYPSVRWKLRNIIKLRETNPEKYSGGIEKLRQILFR